MKTFRSIVVASAAALALAACAGGPGKESTGQVIDDSVITSKIKTSLIAEKGIDSTDISVETAKGRVMLSGDVKSPDQRQMAEGVARKVAGVKEVENKLEVK